jgi:hypothetical protein
MIFGDELLPIFLSLKGNGWYEPFMSKTMIQAELPRELTDRAELYVKEGWALDFNEVLADALRRFLESHSSRVTEAFVMDDVRWGLHGSD